MSVAKPGEGAGLRSGPSHGAERGGAPAQREAAGDDEGEEQHGQVAEAAVRGGGHWRARNTSDTIPQVAEVVEVWLKNPNYSVVIQLNRVRRKKSSNSGAVKSISPYEGEYIIPFLIMLARLGPSDLNSLPKA